jgi:hypothetical protein
MRNIAGVLAGVLAGFATVWLVELIGHSIYPLPSDLNVRNEEDLAASLQTMPFGALLFVVVAWFLGALVGGAVAASIVRRRWPAWLVSGLVAGAAVVTVLMIPHPEWMQVSAVLLPVLGGVIAGHYASRRGASRRKEPADAAL